MLDLGRDATFYYVVLAVLLATLCGAARACSTRRFGRAMQGIRDNETRMEAIGFPTYRYKLLVFVIAGAAAGLAGALLASLNGLVGPNLLHWTAVRHADDHGDPRRRRHAAGRRDRRRRAARRRRGDRRATPIHWPLGIGVMLLAVVLFAPEGLAGLARRWRASP